MRDRLALVLAGGGLAGIAWETGFLLGVQDRAPHAAERLMSADVLLGTSAGSTVAAQISSGASLATLYERQIADETTEIAPPVDIDDLLSLFVELAADTATSRTDLLRQVGARAVSTVTVAEEVRRAVIAARLPVHDWPDRRLELTAIDVDTGERVLFDRHSGVPLIDAVAASSAVPAVWPPVTIGGRRFMDGGIGSSANLEFVRDCEAVVMLAPTAEPGLSPFGRSLADELADLGAPPACGGHFDRAFAVFADDESIAAFGRNVLDPACRAPSAAAGRRQGRSRAADLATFLTV